MILFYAHGGGWGHLTRTKAWVEQNNIKDFRVMTSNTLGLKIFTEDQLLFIDRRWEKDVKGYGEFLSHLFDQKKPSKIIVDVFPNGIMGELSFTEFPSAVKKELFCRRIIWSNYESKTGINDVNYDLSRIFEELEPSHLNYIKDHSKSIIKDRIQYSYSKQLPKEILNFDKGYWLVVHGGRQSEVVELCEYALKEKEKTGSDKDIIVLTEQRISMHGVHTFSTFPARNWYSGAERIFTGAGFNCIHETSPFRDKQTILPFTRKYDDQFWRYAKLMNKESIEATI